MRVLLALLLMSCVEPVAELPPGAPTAAIASINVTPARTDGRTPSIARFEVELTLPLLDPRVIALTGGASPDDLTAYAKNRTTSALRAREIATTSWIEGSKVFAQPVRPLPEGRSTLLILQDKRAPLATELDVAAAEPTATRTWTSANVVTHCAPLVPPLAPIALEPGHVAARVVPRGPCFDVVADRAIGGLVLPPALGSLPLDPSPIGAPELSSLRPEPPCPESAYALGPLCLRVDDDRLVLVGGAETKRAVFGRIGALSIGAAIPIGARHVLRGFPPRTDVPIDLLVRDALGDHPVRQTIATRPPRRHIVINEVLARTPSGATSQRFIELINDGDTAVDLAGLTLRDVDDEWELPDLVVAPGAFALITPEGYVDGLAGEPAPPKGVGRVLVESLRLSGELAIVEADGTVLSRFPPSTSTKVAARARRTPDLPDDAPDVFAFAPPTPGRANVIPP